MSSGKKLPGFAKLFKYDALDLGKYLGICYALLIVSALIARLAASCLTSGDFVAMFAKGLANGFFVSMVVSVLINNFMRLMVRMKANMYGPESYLTNALPVRTRTIWLAWWVVGLISSALSCAMVIAACLIAYEGFGDYVIGHLTDIAQILGVGVAGLAAQLIAVLILELWTAITISMLAIVLGQKANNNQTLRAVLYGLGLYGVTQILILGIVYIMALYNDQLMPIFANTPITDFNSLTSVLALSSIGYLLCVAGASGVAVKSLNRGVNIN